MVNNSNSSREQRNLKGKVNALSGILRLGHESFEKPNLEQLASHIVNNSRLVAGYDRATLVDMRGKWPRLTAIAGQAEVNSNSEFTQNLTNLIQPFSDLKDVATVSNELLDELNAKKGAYEAFTYFESYSDTIILIPLRSKTSRKDNGLFIWVVEFFSRQDKNVAGLLPLLAQHYNEALWYILKPERRAFASLISGSRKKISIPKLLLAAAIIIPLLLLIIPIKQNIAADFEIIPEHDNYYYAPYDGVIAHSNLPRGSKVKPGDPIIVYDTEELSFRLADAQKSYDEISAELETTQRRSFNDISLRSKVQLLELKKDKAAIQIRKNRWLLSRSVVKSEHDGILDIGERSQLDGRAVRSGEKLFEVLSTSDLMAEVRLKEGNASVLNDQKQLAITLYLHNRPEMPINGKIISISPKPVLMENKSYCYLIKFALAEKQPGIICGMRGIARVSGGKVTLGYYLFRNIVLWWRKV
jgi:hypothetical protein